MPQKPELAAADATAHSTEPVPPGLAGILDLLACPACLAPLRCAGELLSCTACERMYPVEDGIPILLVDRVIQPGTIPDR